MDYPGRESASGDQRKKSILKRRQQYPLQNVPGENNASETLRTPSRRVSFSISEVQEYEAREDAKTSWGRVYCYDIQQSSESDSRQGEEHSRRSHFTASRAGGMVQNPQEPVCDNPAMIDMKNAQSRKEIDDCREYKQNNIEGTDESSTFNSLIESLNTSSDEEDNTCFIAPQNTSRKRCHKKNTSKRPSKIREEAKYNNADSSCSPTFSFNEFIEEHVPPFGTAVPQQSFINPGASIPRVYAHETVKKPYVKIEQGSGDHYFVSSRPLSVQGKMVPDSHSCAPAPANVTNTSGTSMSPTVTWGRILQVNVTVEGKQEETSFTDLTEELGTAETVDNTVPPRDTPPSLQEVPHDTPKTSKNDPRKHDERDFNGTKLGMDENIGEPPVKSLLQNGDSAPQKSTNNDNVEDWIRQQLKRKECSWSFVKNQNGSRMHFLFLQWRVSIDINFSSERVEQLTVRSRMAGEPINNFLKIIMSKRLNSLKPTMNRMLKLRSDIPNFVTYVNREMEFYEKFASIWLNLKLFYLTTIQEETTVKIRVVKPLMGYTFVIQIDLSSWTGGRLLPENITVIPFYGEVSEKQIKRLTGISGSGPAVLWNFMKNIERYLKILEEFADSKSE